MKLTTTEIMDAPAGKPASFAHQSDCLRSKVTGVNKKMKAILDVLENYDSPLQTAEIEKITEIVQNLCLSYHSLAEEYDCLKTGSIEACKLESSLPLNDRSEKDIDSCPESTVEDADNECEDTMNEPEHIQGFVENPVSNDSKSESAASDGVRYQIAKLVEENAQIQVELIRRNSEKRDAIRKLQNKVSRLSTENDTLRRTLSYYDRKNHHIQETTPRRKATLFEKFFRGCFVIIR